MMMASAMDRVSPGCKGANRAVGARTVLRSGDTSRRPEIVVAAPVCNEIDRIEACLDALAATLSRQPNAGVVLMVNNSVDGTANRAFAVLTKHRIAAIIVNTGLASPWRRRAGRVVLRWIPPRNGDGPTRC